MIAALMPKHSIHKHYIKSAHKNWFNFPLICFSCNTLPSSPNSNTCLYTHTHTHTHPQKELIDWKQSCEIWGCHSFAAEDASLLGYDRVSMGEWFLMFWTLMAPSASGSNSMRRRLLGLHHVLENLNLQRLSLSLCHSFESLTSKLNGEVCLDLSAKRTYMFFFSSIISCKIIQIIPQLWKYFIMIHLAWTSIWGWRRLVHRRTPNYCNPKVYQGLWEISRVMRNMHVPVIGRIWIHVTGPGTWKPNVEIVMAIAANLQHGGWLTLDNTV